MFLIFYLSTTFFICFLSSFFFFKQKTAYEMRISDCSSDVCSSDLDPFPLLFSAQPTQWLCLTPPAVRSCRRGHPAHDAFPRGRSRPGGPARSARWYPAPAPAPAPCGRRCPRCSHACRGRFRCSGVAGRPSRAPASSEERQEGEEG